MERPDQSVRNRRRYHTMQRLCNEESILCWIISSYLDFPLLRSLVWRVRFVVVDERDDEHPGEARVSYWVRYQCCYHEKARLVQLAVAVRQNYAYERSK